MSIISFYFVLFFAACLILYYILPLSFRVPLLLFASLVFLLSYSSYAVFFILISTLSSYLFARKLQKSVTEESDFVLSYDDDKEKIRLYRKKSKKSRRLWLALSILPNIGVLFVFKISPFFAFSRSWLFPLGLSFYSLRAVSYLCDVYRKKTEAEESFWRFLLYMTYFPLILQGPIAKYSEISDRIFTPHRAEWENIISGILRVLFGTFKKAVIANGFSIINAAIAGDSAEFDGAYVLLLLCLYTAEIYADFSGGIDIMIGVSNAFGIVLPENFDIPFVSLSVREYWNRWHITLGEWFENYVFYPLSLSKPMQRLSRLCRQKLGRNVGKRIPLYISTLTTWFLTGFWHGASANYIVWGLLNGILVLFSQEIQPISTRLKKLILGEYPSKTANIALTFFGRIRTFFLIGALRLLDVYGNVPLTFKMLAGIFYDGKSYVALFRGGMTETGLDFVNIAVPMSGCLILLAVGGIKARGQRALTDKIKEHGAQNVSNYEAQENFSLSRRIAESPYLCAASLSALLVVTLVFGRYGFGFEATDFIYSQF